VTLSCGALEAPMLESLTLNDFTDLVGAMYTLAVGERRMPMVLTEAKAVSEGPLGDGTRVPFSLVFDTTEPGYVEQATYGVTHPSGEVTEIFLVPIAKTKAGGVRLQAIFT
jgi:hypothetical protein